MRYTFYLYIPSRPPAVSLLNKSHRQITELRKAKMLEEVKSMRAQRIEWDRKRDDGDESKLSEEKRVGPCKVSKFILTSLKSSKALADLLSFSPSVKLLRRFYGRAKRFRKSRRRRPKYPKSRACDPRIPLCHKMNLSLLLIFSFFAQSFYVAREYTQIMEQNLQ